MSKNHGEPEASLASRQMVANRSSIVSIAFNVGLAMFVMDGFWQLLHGPFSTLNDQFLNTVLFYAGLGIAASMWVTTSRKPRWIKCLLTLIVVIVALLAAFESMWQFDLRQRELKTGTVVNGRVFYPGLGMSFGVPSDWQMNLQPSITKRNKPIRGKDVFPLCIQYGDTAVYFQAMARTGADGAAATADSIQIEGGPFIFRSLGRTVASIRKLESSYQSMKGVRIVRPLRFYQRENMDFADFEVLDETSHILYRHVFARSGDTRLDFVLTTSGDQAPQRFDEFVKSIRITRRPTLFND